MSKRAYTSSGVVLNLAIALLRKEPELSNQELAERIGVRAAAHSTNMRMARRALGLPSDEETVRSYGAKYGAKKRAAAAASDHRVLDALTHVSEDAPAAIAPSTPPSTGSRDDDFKMQVIDALAVLKAYVEATL